MHAVDATEDDVYNVITVGTKHLSSSVVPENFIVSIFAARVPLLCSRDVGDVPDASHFFVPTSETHYDSYQQGHTTTPMSLT